MRVHWGKQSNGWGTVGNIVCKTPLASRVYQGKWTCTFHYVAGLKKKKKNNKVLMLLCWRQPTIVNLLTAVNGRTHTHTHTKGCSGGFELNVKCFAAWTAGAGIRQCSNTLYFVLPKVYMSCNTLILHTSPFGTSLLLDSKSVLEHFDSSFGSSID